MQHLAVHADEVGRGLVAGGVEGEAVLRALRLMHRNAAVGAGRRVPEVRGKDVVVGGELAVKRLASRVGARDLWPREDVGDGQHGARYQDDQH